MGGCLTGHVLDVGRCDWTIAEGWEGWLAAAAAGALGCSRLTAHSSHRATVLLQLLCWIVFTARRPMMLARCMSWPRVCGTTLCVCLCPSVRHKAEFNKND